MVTGIGDAPRRRGRPPALQRVVLAVPPREPLLVLGVLVLFARAPRCADAEYADDEDAELEEEEGGGGDEDDGPGGAEDVLGVVVALDEH